MEQLASMNSNFGFIGLRVLNYKKEYLNAYLLIQECQVLDKWKKKLDLNQKWKITKISMRKKIDIRVDADFETKT